MNSCICADSKNTNKCIYLTKYTYSLLLIIQYNRTRTVIRTQHVNDNDDDAAVVVTALATLN